MDLDVCLERPAQHPVIGLTDLHEQRREFRGRKLLSGQVCEAALTGYVWLQLPDRIREVHRQCLEFWYDPPGCALIDEEVELLRRIAAANAPVMFQAVGRTTPAHLALGHRVDVLRDLRKAGWIVLEVWVAEPGNRGHARRRYSAAQAYCTESGREALWLIGG